MSIKVTTVYVRLTFLRIGEIDTLNEKYQAQASVESRWIVDFEQLSTILSAEDQQSLIDGKSVSLPKYTDSHWHPQIYIENALGDLKEQIRYTAKKSRENDQIYVCEHRDIKGLFWEKLELQYFPADVQDLSISVASMLYDDRAILLPDHQRNSGVNREAFVDQQEWSLFAHVDTEQRTTNEFNTQFTDEDNDQAANVTERKHTIVTVTCHAARRSSYFYWNGYCLIFLITLVSFTCYFIPLNSIAGRVQTTSTLLLTSITFRWTPTISYLTTLDIYGIACIFLLVINGIWHAACNTIANEFASNFKETPATWEPKIDRMAFYVIFGVFIFGLAIFQNIEEKHGDFVSNKTIKVYVRLMFLRIGEIDTLNEKYQAQAAIEARWSVELDKIISILSLDDRKRLTDGKSVSLLQYSVLHWHPQLYIENVLGDLKEQIRYTVKKSKENDQIYVCEHRDIKGLFWEKLELHYFPSDIQDLSISIASMFYNDRVILLADPNHLSGVNREAFVDQQEWKLYSHVDTESRYVTEYLIRDSEEEDDDENEPKEYFNKSEDQKRSILTITCHAARRSNYFYWNGYCLILLITLMAFCIFAIPAHESITCAYLFLFTSDFRVTRDMWLVHVDHCVFMSSISIFIIIHLILLTWLYYVPLKSRRQMAKKDMEYRQLIRNEKKNVKYTPILI
ncbi:hypothetical protein I4U23_014941 [Adineta vaga]|nr:hypothetical protein I4U23_014941 [Adineta vaga]